MSNQLIFIPISTTNSLLTRRPTFTDSALNKLDKIVARENIVRHFEECQKQCLTGKCGVVKSRMLCCGDTEIATMHSKIIK